nr:DUF4394 domain-containing protein [Spirosoma spitsbergense]
MRMFYGKSTRFITGLLAVSFLIMLDACQDKQQLEPTAQNGRAGARLASNYMFYVLTDNNQLVKLNTQNPSTSLGTVAITGLMPNERLIGIDFRPATGQLYAVSNGSRIYSINVMSGLATALGTTPFTPAIMGSDVGFDFNPTVDRIRLVTNTGQDLRLNPETGAVVSIDGSINGVAGASISGVAYTNSRSGVTTTTLYDLDPVTDKLYRQNPPNNGTLEEVGPLGVDISGLTNFDIAPDGSAIATMISGGVQALYEIDLTTGRATMLGGLPGSMSIVGLAIPSEAVAYVVDGANTLYYINPMTGVTTTTKPLTGLQSGETLFGIDMRPATGQLFAMGSTGRVYAINMGNGAATAIGDPISPALEGSDVGFDFNPTVDRIRIVTNTGQDLRYNPLTNGVTIDGRLNPGNPVVTGAAYTNSFAGATTTTLYDIDTRTSGMLFRQNPPNDGTLVPVGPLNVAIEGGNGFDIGGMSGVGYAMMRADKVDRLYTINLMTGLATEVAPLAGNPSSIRGFTVGLGF